LLLPRKFSSGTDKFDKENADSVPVDKSTNGKFNILDGYQNELTKTPTKLRSTLADRPLLDN
jgi:hypothetical protein